LIGKFSENIFLDFGLQGQENGSARALVCIYVIHMNSKNHEQRKRFTSMSSDSSLKSFGERMDGESTKTPRTSGERTFGWRSTETAK